MMQRKFQYMVMGAGLALFVIFGALTFLLSPAQASYSSDAIAKEAKATTNWDAGSNNDESLDVTVVTTVVTEEDFSSHWGTSENPDTDATKISAQVEALATMHKTNTLKNPGWLYHRYERYVPRQYLSNTGEIYGIPVTELYSDDYMICEEWFLIDADGQFSKNIGHAIDRKGNVGNQWATTDGKMVNFSLVGVAPHAVNETSLSRPFSFDGNMLMYLEAVKSDPLSSVQAWRDGDAYIVVLNIIHEEPIVIANMGDVTVIGERIKYLFDLTSGVVQQTEIAYQDIDGEFLLLERAVYLEHKLVDELPQDADHILREAAELMKETKQ